MISRKMSSLFFAAVAVAAGAPALGAALRGLWLLALLFLAQAGLWFLTHQRRWPTPPVFLFSLAGLGVAVWVNVRMGWLLVGGAAVLMAYDLEAFNAHLARISRIENSSRLIDAHLRRLALTGGGSLLVGGLGRLLRVQIGFVPALILALLLVLGSGYVLHHLDHPSEHGADHVSPAP